jgi:hypothetical protein
MRLRWTAAVVGAVGLAVVGLLVSVSVARPAHADTTGLDDVVLSHTFKGTRELYNYAPTVVQSGTTRHYYWCGYDFAYAGHDSDTILTQSYDTRTHEKSAVSVALAPTKGRWDYGNTCNPSVVMGKFENPLGDGKTYDIALYYVGSTGGSHNSIGVAYSTDWHTFRKRATPVLSPPTDCADSYGYGQPTAYNHDGHGRIWLFYDDTCASRYRRVEIDNGVRGATSTVTVMGFPRRSKPSPGLEFAYDSAARVWYGVGGWDTDARRTPTWTDYRGRPTTREHGVYTFQLYKIAEGGLVTGSSPWTEVTRVDTNLIGYESTTIPTIVRDAHGNVNISGVYPSIVMPFGVSNIRRPPASSTVADDAPATDKPHWKISEITWRPGHPLRPFKRYFSASLHRNEVTTGYVDTRTFEYERTLGSLYEEPNGAAIRALYGCRHDPDDYFVSTRADCEGQKVLGLDGYAYPSSGSGHDVALYRCNTGTFHLVTSDPGCEGWTREQLLGYAHD